MSKLTISLLFLFFLLSTTVKGIDPDSLIFKIDSIVEPIELNRHWKYHPGDDTLWADPEFHDDTWDIISSKLYVDRLEKVEFDGLGWFRLHIKIDSSFRNKTYALHMDQQGASEIYLNGVLIATNGTVAFSNSNEVTYSPNHIPILIQFDEKVNYILAI